MEYTKEFLKEKLSTNQRWMERALIVLYNRQTEDEKESKMTRVLNGRGFSGSDSRYLTWCTEWLLRDKNNHLSGHHLIKLGRMLPKYWKQIFEEIELRGN